MKKIIKINGMGCGHCIESVREALAEISGIKVYDVKLGMAEVEISDEKQLDIIREKLDDVGYDME